MASDRVGQSVAVCVGVDKFAQSLALLALSGWHGIFVATPGHVLQTLAALHFIDVVGFWFDALCGANPLADRPAR